MAEATGLTAAINALQAAANSGNAAAVNAISAASVNNNPATSSAQALAAAAGYGGRAGGGDISQRFTPSIFPNLPTAPSGVSTNQLSLGATAGGSPAAAGFDIFSTMLDFVLKANADRRASIDQTINIGRFLVDLERVSPTRAAALATKLGVASDYDFTFLNAFGAGQGLAPSSGGRIGGPGGVSLPQSLSGRDLSFLNANPNVANIVRDYAEMVGLPDIFSRSQAGLIPGSGMLASLDTGGGGGGGTSGGGGAGSLFSALSSTIARGSSLLGPVLGSPVSPINDFQIASGSARPGLQQPEFRY